MVTIRPFCRENMDYIMNDPDFIKRMSDIVRPGSVKALLKLVEWKYMDPLHPENHNIKYNAENTSTLEIYNGSAWFPRESNEALQSMFDRICDDIDNFLGYMKTVKIPLTIKKFKTNIAVPLQFDMLNVDIGEAEVDENIKTLLFTETLKLLSKK